MVAARTADGRVWLAWIVSVAWSFCAGDSSAATENGSLRLVEIDPASTHPREAMRVELDIDNLPTEAIEYDFSGNKYDVYDGALSLAAFGQQLVLAVADGPEHARLRVLSVDTSR